MTESEMIKRKLEIIRFILDCDETVFLKFENALKELEEQ